MMRDFSWDTSIIPPPNQAKLAKRHAKKQARKAKRDANVADLRAQRRADREQIGRDFNSAAQGFMTIPNDEILGALADKWGNGERLGEWALVEPVAGELVVKWFGTGWKGALRAGSVDLARVPGGWLGKIDEAMDRLVVDTLADKAAGLI